MEDGVINFLTVQQPYQMGYMAYKAAADAANGVELEHGMVLESCVPVGHEGRGSALYSFSYVLLRLTW